LRLSSLILGEDLLAGQVIAISSRVFLRLTSRKSPAFYLGLKEDAGQIKWIQHFHHYLVFNLREETGMEQKSRSNIRVDAGIGMFWFIGWLFTLAFAKLIWWQAIVGLVIWPYYLGLAAR
jgi:hypothetical protein